MLPIIEPRTWNSGGQVVTAPAIVERERLGEDVDVLNTTLITSQHYPPIHGSQLSTLPLCKFLYYRHSTLDL
jgi:hypothetical protein